MNDHSESWTEHQLVAAARGQPIPPPDQIPSLEESPSPTEDRRVPAGNSNFSAFSTPSRSTGGSSDPTEATAPPLPPNLASSPPGSTPSPLVRGRTKPLAPLSSASNANDSDITRHEIQLPKNPQINGQPLEAYLYKDVAECPICFLYYPPYLNRTRCCDQPICSECFVQIKRPDPHTPEHTDPNSEPPDVTEHQAQGEEVQLISEPATCPFCKVPELGITYDSPPFRRGLAYAAERGAAVTKSANSSSKRPRGQSLSVNHPDVITTDTVRPDWDKKLSDARMHLGRRAAAATALHNAAYLMNNERGSVFPGLGRRRRQLFVDAGSGSSSGGVPRPEQFDQRQLEQIMAAIEAARNGNLDDMFPRRGSSRGEQTQDIEQYLMARAIRESLQDEEDRRRKAAKEAEKERKKEEKQREKDQKKAAKAARKNGVEYPSSNNNSAFFQAGPSGPSEPVQPPMPSLEGKGKARAKDTTSESSRTRPGYQPGGFNPLEEPTSTLRDRDIHSTEPFPGADESQEAQRDASPPTVDDFNGHGQAGLYLQAAGLSTDQTGHGASQAPKNEANLAAEEPQTRGMLRETPLPPASIATSTLRPVGRPSVFVLPSEEFAKRFPFTARSMNAQEFSQKFPCSARAIMREIEESRKARQIKFARNASRARNSTARRSHTTRAIAAHIKSSTGSSRSSIVDIYELSRHAIPASDRVAQLKDSRLPRRTQSTALRITTQAQGLRSRFTTPSPLPEKFPSPTANIFTQADPTVSGGGFLRRERSQSSPQHPMLPPIDLSGSTALKFEQHGDDGFSTQVENTASTVADSRIRGASSASQSQPPKYQIDEQVHDHGDDVDSKHGSNVAVVGHAESA